MLLITLSTIGIVIVFLVLNYRNRFAYVLSMYFLGIAVLMIAGVLYNAGISSYSYFTQWDYQLYLFLSNIKMSIPEIAWLHNIGVSLIMTCSIAFLLLFYPKRWKFILLLLIPVIYFLYVNSPGLCWKLYLKLYTTGALDEVEKIQWMIDILRISSILLVLIYLLIPLTSLICYYGKTKISMKRRYALVFLGCLLAIYAILYLVFVKGPFRSTMFYHVDLMKFPVEQLQSYSTMAMPLCIGLIAFIVIVVALYFRPFNALSTMSRKELERVGKTLNKNVRMVLHIHKNAFLSIEKLALMGRECIQDKNEAALIQTFEEIGQQADTSLRSISRMLDMLSDVAIDYHHIHITDCIEKALTGTVIPKEITVEKDYRCTDAVVLGDITHLTEIFINLLRNAVEAIEQKKQTEGKIYIGTESEQDMVSIVVKDNGCGVAKKERKKIFRAFYTTKPVVSGGGVGLDYVYRVVKMHNGDITVKSREGEWTLFQVVLPLCRKKLKI